MDSQNYIIGVDAGGTKTAAWLGLLQHTDKKTLTVGPLQEQVQVLGMGLSGPGNPRRVGFEAATESILTAIKIAYQTADREFTRAASICMGVAGAGRPSEQQQLQQWCLQSGLASRARITGDALPLLAATYASQPVSSLRGMQGIALICGTGSMAWGCHSDSADGNLHEARAGGWGYLLGDEGSAYWIGMKALQMLCRGHDESKQGTRLAAVILQQLAVERVTDLVQWLYSGPVDRSAIAALAPLVTGLAEDLSPDSLSIQIVEQAAEELARIVLCVAKQLPSFSNSSNHRVETRLAMTGGVLLGCLLMQSRLQHFLQPHLFAMVPVESPAQGALFLAADLAME